MSGLNFLNQVDEDIWQLKRRLPPIDRKAILRQMKAESQAQVQADRHCTCEMVECSQEEAEKAAGGELCHNIFHSPFLTPLPALQWSMPPWMIFLIH